MAFPFPHRVRFVGIRTEPWSRARHPRRWKCRRTLRLPAGKPFADAAGSLVGRVAVFVVEPA